MNRSNMVRIFALELDKQRGRLHMEFEDYAVRNCLEEERNEDIIRRWVSQRSTTSGLCLLVISPYEEGLKIVEKLHLGYRCIRLNNMMIDNAKFDAMIREEQDQAREAVMKVAKRLIWIKGPEEVLTSGDDFFIKLLGRKI